MHGTHAHRPPKIAILECKVTPETNIIMGPSWQDQDWDSSDEEWEIANSGMDPLTRLHWGSMVGVDRRGAAQMVRDVLLAADVVHEDAMSEMGGATQGEGERDNNMDLGRDAWTSSSVEGSQSLGATEEGDIEGEHVVTSILPQSPFNL